MSNYRLKSHKNTSSAKGQTTPVLYQLRGAGKGGGQQSNFDGLSVGDNEKKRLKIEMK